MAGATKADGNKGIVATPSVAEEPAEEVAPVAPSGELIALPWETTGLNPLYYNQRTIKMVKPSCDTCQKSRRKDWYVNCAHQPYFDMALETVQVPVTVCDECKQPVSPEAIQPTCHPQAAIEVTGMTEKQVRRPKLRTVEVPLSMANNSGRAVEDNKRKGFKTPEELGFAPMCQFARCYAPNPKIKTGWGDYCSREHAVWSGMNGKGEAIEVLHPEKRDSQVRAVDIG